MTSSRRNGDERRIDASLWGIGDRELLGIVDDLADENGWATTLAVRAQLGEDPWEPQRTGVGVRLGYMRKSGWLEKGERERVESEDDRGWRWSQSWRLTAMGHAVLDGGDLTKQLQNLLDRLNPAQRIRVTREIASAGTADEIRTALRREWQRSFGR